MRNTETVQKPSTWAARERNGQGRKAPARGMDGNTQVTPDIETIQPAHTPLRAHLRNPRVRLGLIAGLVLLVLLGLARFITDRAAYVSTSDARIAADMIAVSTDISGKITSQRVSAGDMVKAGDILYTIDEREAAYTLAEY